METESDHPRLGRLLLATVAFAILVGGAWYIAYLRAENTRLTGQPRQAPAVTPVRPAARAGTGGSRALSAQQRDALLGGLRGAPMTERPVWFVTAANDPEATAFRLTFQTLFEEAGWDIRSNGTATFPIKPGLFLFSADEEPPEYVHIVVDSLEAAGLTVTMGRGYRQFYEERKRSNPSWNGFELMPDQTYVFVIGPKPPPSPTSKE